MGNIDPSAFCYNEVYNEVNAKMFQERVKQKEKGN